LGDCFLWGSFLIKYISSPKFWATFIHGKSCVLILKNGLGPILGDLVTDSSGRPDAAFARIKLATGVHPDIAALGISHSVEVSFWTRFLPTGWPDEFAKNSPNMLPNRSLTK
jgi:hypothetical protein